MLSMHPENIKSESNARIQKAAVQWCLVSKYFTQWLIL